MNVFELLPELINSRRVDDHLQQAAKIICENDCESFSVLDGDGREVGMITARDICLAARTGTAGPFWHMAMGSAIAKPTASGTNRR
jgi:predicted transcriptional regulator